MSARAGIPGLPPVREFLLGRVALPKFFKVEESRFILQ